MTGKFLPKGSIYEVSFGIHSKMGGYTTLMSDIYYLAMEHQNKENEIRPDKVSTAVTLLYVALVIGVIRGIIGISTLTQTESLVAVIIGSFITLAIIAIFAFFHIYDWKRSKLG